MKNLIQGKVMDNADIKQLRMRLGLTQKELATRLKLDAITISRWERGTQRPSNLARRQLTRLANKGD